MRAGKSGEDLIFEIALEDITRAADLFRPIHERTRHIYWASREPPPSNSLGDSAAEPRSSA